MNTLYWPHGPTGGAEATLRFLASQLVGRGHRCVIITLTPDDVATTGEIDGIPVYYIPLANVLWPHAEQRSRLKRPIFQLIDAYNPIMRRRVEHVLRDLRPDVIHAHNLQGFSVSTWVAAHRLGIPLVQTAHDYYLACPRSTMWRPKQGNCIRPCVECWIFSLPRRRLSLLPTAFTSVSHRVWERLSLAGLALSRQSKIIRGNNSAEKLKTTARTSSQGVLRLGFIGRLDPVKGLENLLAALAGLPPGAVQLTVAGRGGAEYEAALQSQIRPGTNVTFIGHVSPDMFFPMVDLVVIPSVWEDPFPRVWHEALQYGVPSLVTPLGGLQERVEQGRTGFIAASADAQGLHAQLSDLLGSGWDPASMRDACLAAAADYTPTRIIDQYEHVLTDAAELTAPALGVTASPRRIR